MGVEKMMRELNSVQPFIAANEQNISIEKELEINATAQPDERTKTSQAGQRLCVPPPKIQDLIKKFSSNGLALNAIVALASPLINLAHVMRYMQTQPDNDDLRHSITTAVKVYWQDLKTVHVNAQQAQMAHYIICATIDDVVLSTTWGPQTGWSQNTLVSTFHMSVTGGERVFDLLETFLADQEVHKDLLLLTYLCLSLAFEGRMRIADDGRLQLIEMRQAICKILAPESSNTEEALSPHWQGISAPHKPLGPNRIAYSLILSALFISLCSYFLFGFFCDRAFNKLRMGLLNYQSYEVASILSSKPNPPFILPKNIHKSKHPEPDTPKVNRLDVFGALLKADIDKKLVTLISADGRLTIRINHSGLFAAGEANVADRFRPLIKRIGSALMAESFRTLIIGYTDNVPIHTTLFPSNSYLSAARANAVGDIIATFTGRTGLTIEGRGDSDPLADNKTAAGRQANRRIEIIVMDETYALPESKIP